MHYYTLTETPSDTRVALPSNWVPLRLDRVNIPMELDRAQIVRRIDPTRLQIVEGDRWAAPLDDMIRRVLSDDLALRLPVNMVADPNEPSVGEKRQSLSVDISEFYGDRACAVTLRAAWALKQSDSQISRGSEEVRIAPSGDCGGTGSLPLVLSQALGQLSDRIANAISHTGESSS
jgi:uncharacterized lipoprotein YmbA